VTSVGLSSRQEIRSQPNAGLLTSPRSRSVILGLLLAIATLALYYPVHSHPFLNYDDSLYVTENDQVQAGLTWLTVKWAFTTFEMGEWHPLTWLSHALDCQLFGLDPSGHHDTSLLLHTLNVLLLFWVLQAATGYLGRSAMVAALFALHPINVESVAWIAERKNLLSMMFFLLALGSYRWYAREPKLGRYAVVAFLYALGLLAKPQVITMIGLVQVGGQAMADRYAYQSFLGLFIMICWGVANFQPATRTSGASSTPILAKAAPLGDPGTWTQEGHTSNTWLAIASLAILLAVAAVAHRQLWYWRDSVALWTHAAEVTSGNWMAEDFLGGLMLELGKPQDAIPHHYRALALNPRDPVSNLNLGSWQQHDSSPARQSTITRRCSVHPARPRC